MLHIAIGVGAQDFGLACGAHDPAGQGVIWRGVQHFADGLDPVRAFRVGKARIVGKGAVMEIKGRFHENILIFILLIDSLPQSLKGFAMRRQFNKETHIVVTGENGDAVNIERRRIKSFTPTDDDGDDRARGLQSVMTHLVDDGTDAEIETKVKEDCSEILAMLKDGKPSVHHARAWEQAIIEERRSDAEHSLKQVVEGEAYLAHGPDHRLSHRFCVEMDKCRAVVGQIDEKFGDSRRLTVARALHEYGKREASSVWGAMAGRAASLLAWGDASDLHARDTNAASGEQYAKEHEYYRKQEVGQHEREGDRLAADREKLERLRDDPQMTPDDRARLDRKINDFTRDHADPDFRYNRDVTNGRVEIHRQELGEGQSPSQDANPLAGWIEKYRERAAEKAEQEGPKPSGPSRSQRMRM